ncbi:MAG TPA: sugar ABC transporter ATP-binding protein [Geminicoccus sp.]|jgi:ribose transport system ATP-binding protein|uniref:sugar ABC transporter ATP-binding protein n=1 Tax=Geminicoccus sp. TaxID=2024832 RepID=UPI002E34B7E3|nr:sugar ABC transporter ATP-binding protein [Geminicoccus sp.]HEX2525960.1 sugar ABC transporter ATP-binding protein [Geminicoccus sp.]
MPPALKAHGVTKQFDAVVALSNGALTVEHGEIHALLGANGCGKSTLCKIIAGTVLRNGGSIEVDGAPLVPKGPADSEAAGIALFYQELSLVPQLTVAENIYLGHEPRTAAGFIDHSKLQADANALLEQFAAVAGSGLALHSLVARLSPDQRQIVEILKVLARRPRLIIFDEATAALDRRQVEFFFRMLRALKAQGVSMIFISHRLDEVFEICDRITVMRNGETVATFSTAETDMNRVVHAMVGEMAEHLHPPHVERPPGEAPRLIVEHASGQRLRDVSLMLWPGEILGLGGLQGQGQSALLRGLFGADPLASGTVSLGNMGLRLRKPADAVHHGIAYISGDRGRDAALHGRSIFENIAAASFIRERRVLVWPIRLAERFRQAAASLNTRYPGLEEPIGSLSGGNQQKIFIARWLATKPSVLLLDDPTKGIDLAAKADFFDLVRGLAAEGTSILFYSSEDAELLGLCHRILVFNGGAISAELSGQALTALNLTGAAYGNAA